MHASGQPSAPQAAGNRPTAAAAAATPHDASAGYEKADGARREVAAAAPVVDAQAYETNGMVRVLAVHSPPPSADPHKGRPSWETRLAALRERRASESASAERTVPYFRAPGTSQESTNDGCYDDDESMVRSSGEANRQRMRVSQHGRFSTSPFSSVLSTTSSDCESEGTSQSTQRVFSLVSPAPSGHAPRDDAPSAGAPSRDGGSLPPPVPLAPRPPTGGDSPGFSSASPSRTSSVAATTARTPVSHLPGVATTAERPSLVKARPTLRRLSSNISAASTATYAEAPIYERSFGLLSWRDSPPSRPIRAAPMQSNSDSDDEEEEDDAEAQQLEAVYGANAVPMDWHVRSPSPMEAGSPHGAVAANPVSVTDAEERFLQRIAALHGLGTPPKVDANEQRQPAAPPSKPAALPGTTTEKPANGEGPKAAENSASAAAADTKAVLTKRPYLRERATTRRPGGWQAGHAKAPQVTHQEKELHTEPESAGEGSTPQTGTAKEHEETSQPSPAATPAAAAGTQEKQPSPHDRCDTPHSESPASSLEPGTEGDAPPPNPRSTAVPLSRRLGAEAAAVTSNESAKTALSNGGAADPLRKLSPPSRNSGTPSRSEESKTAKASAAAPADRATTPSQGMVDGGDGMKERRPARANGTASDRVNVPRVDGPAVEARAAPRDRESRTTSDPVPPVPPPQFTPSPLTQPRQHRDAVPAKGSSTAPPPAPRLSQKPAAARPLLSQLVAQAMEKSGAPPLAATPSPAETPTPSLRPVRAAVTAPSEVPAPAAAVVGSLKVSELSSPALAAPRPRPPSPVASPDARRQVHPRSSSLQLHCPSGGASDWHASLVAGVRSRRDDPRTGRPRCPSGERSQSGRVAAAWSATSPGAWDGPMRSPSAEREATTRATSVPSVATPYSAFRRPGQTAAEPGTSAATAGGAASRPLLSTAIYPAFHATTVASKYKLTDGSAAAPPESANNATLIREGLEMESYLSKLKMDSLHRRTARNRW